MFEWGGYGDGWDVVGVGVELVIDGVGVIFGVFVRAN